MTAQLIGLEGVYAGRMFLLSNDPVSLGRDATNTIPIDNRLVSRRHIEIHLDGTESVLTNLDSLNGVLVNGEQVRQTRLLRHGDRITIANESFRFEHADEDGSTQPQARLIGIDGALSKKLFMLSTDPLQLGRDPSSSVHLTDGLASRRHAEIRLTEQGYLLIDKNSRNGITVNGVRLSAPHLLQHGDLITLGGATFRFERSASPRAVSAAETQATQDYSRSDVNRPRPASPFKTAITCPSCEQLVDVSQTPVAEILQNGLRCPHCQRVINFVQQHCPWDGALLANGEVVLGAPNQNRP